MADYNVSEVLKNILDHEDPTWKPSDKIPLISKEIESRKNELKSFLAGSDYDIQSIIKETDELCSESELLVDHLGKCKKEIEEETMAEIVKSIENYTTLSKELECVSFAMNLVSGVIQCGRYVKEFDDGREQQSFTRSVEGVCELIQYLDQPTDGFILLEIASKTRETAQLILDNLIHELYLEWSRLIYWEVKTSTRKTTVNITIKLDESFICYDMLRALEICKKIPEKISEFAQFLFKEILTPLLHNECAVVVETDDFATISIIHGQNSKPAYMEVLSNNRMLFYFLNKKLNINFKGDPNITIMSMLGQQLSTKYAEILIGDCLIDTIPNNITDLQSYEHITMQIQEFQSFLVSVHFFPSDNSISILKYVENIDVLFANKTSNYVLEYARTIMLKDLSATMSIGVEGIPIESSSSTNDNVQEALNILNKTIPESLFYFPRCMISKSTQELLDLVHMVMEQAVQCPDGVCKKLYNTTRLIFELYDAVVPYHHENYLQTIPQYVALFHNNCMFLAHNLQMLGDKWFTLMGGSELSYPISFVDLVQKLRDLGYKHLTIHMQQQRTQILDNIRSSDLNCIVVKDVLGDNAEAAIRQCLRQLHILKNVWIGVFPSNVFMRLMATLVNMFLEELIHRVCTVEDISMEMAQQLTEMYSLVVQKAPQLFQVAQTTNSHSGRQFEQERIWSSADMQKHVKSWTKLQELIFVLGGSLKDIENHWNDGTGPLAIHFRTEELRSLIKALFQNTQIRANLLSKIK